LLIARRCPGRSQRPPEHSLSPNATREVQKDTNARCSARLKGPLRRRCAQPAVWARLPWNSGSSLDDGDGGNREARQIDREDATPARKGACIDTAIVRFSPPPAEGEPKTHARAIGAALLERTKELEEPQALAPACRFSIDAGLGSLAPVLGHRARDGTIRASVQYPKVFGTDRCVQFHRQFGDGLTGSRQ
jgi:hypothetical protein